MMVFKSGRGGARPNAGRPKGIRKPIKSATNGGMASFDIAKNTMTTIGFECPIWLIGIGE